LEIKLIAFDLDGVLVDSKGSWMEVHNVVGTAKQSEIHGKEFYEGKITFDEWARKDVSLWKGIEINKIYEALYKIPPMNGIEAIKKLRKKYKLAIISGGLKILAERIKKEYKFKYCFANSLIVKEGKIYGFRHQVDFKGKGEILKEIAKKENLSLNECASVGDYINDISMFDVSGFSVAFNPKHADVVKHADAVIYNKDLNEILKFF